METTKIFLLYHEEDISIFNHPDIIPVKLNQTEYFESEFFRMIHPEDIPNVDNIGIITPSLFKKCKDITLDRLFEMRPNPHIVKLFPTSEPCENNATGYHGIFFVVLWSWILEQYDISYLNFNEYPCFFSNLWITKRNLFIEYLAFAKNTMNLIDNAPLRIKEVLETNPNYRDSKLSREILELRFGKSYYPWQPFLMERLICLFIHLKETGQC